MHMSAVNLFFRRGRYKFVYLSKFLHDIMNYYAVAKGRVPGIYHTWDDCKKQVHQFSGPIFKKFSSKAEAENFIKQHKGATSYYQKSAVASKKESTLSRYQSTLKSKTNTSTKRQLSTLSDVDDSESPSPCVKRKKLIKKSEGDFSVDENGFTEVYTDGACSSNGRGNARAGVGVWFSDNNALNVSAPVIGRATNNMAEIQAVTTAARQAQKAGITKLKINTDSQFLISCITQWMPKWKRSGWQTTNKQPVINRQELVEMEEALSSLEVSWNHVRGHVGVYGNEMADKLAREGCEQYRRK